jgi:Na+-driven multidrug efflux pump
MVFILQFINTISTSLFSIIGNYNATEEKSKVMALFYQYLFSLMFISNILCIPLYFSFNQFIELWVGSRMLLPETTMVFFVTILYYSICMIPVTTLIAVNGLFKETKIAIYIEILINVGLSIILVNILGIKGVLIATVISGLVSRFIYYPYTLYRKVFNSKSIEFYKRILKNIFITSIICIVIYKLDLKMNSEDLIGWFVYGIKLFSITLCIAVPMFYIFFKKEFKLIYNKVLKRRR